MFTLILFGSYFFNLSINIPIFFVKEYFKNIWSTTFILSEFKALEFELYYYSKMLFEFNLKISTPLQQDHHGINFEIGLFGFTFGITFYDKRHIEDFDAD